MNEVKNMAVHLEELMEKANKHKMAYEVFEYILTKESVSSTKIPSNKIDFIKKDVMYHHTCYDNILKQIKSIKPECLQCGYYDKGNKVFYKCKVDGTCPSFFNISDIEATHKKDLNMVIDHLVQGPDYDK